MSESINFELYKVFYYVAGNLSFSHASGKLHISQSAVSQAVKSLEDALGCKLFIRTTKQVKLTQEGQRLFEHIEQAYNFIKAGERSIADIQSLQFGEIRIGASDTICKYHLLPCFKRFNELYPNVKISVTNRTSLKCIELLKKGSVDVIVVNIPHGDAAYKDLTVKRIGALKDVFVAGPQFSKLQNRQISIQDLQAYPLLMLEANSVTREFFDRITKHLGLTIIPEIELGSIDLLVEMAKIGLGIAFVPEEYARKELEAGDLFKVAVAEKFPPRYLGVATLSSIPPTKAVEKFIGLLEQNGEIATPFHS